MNKIIIKVLIIMLIATVIILGVSRFVNYIQERNIECESLGIETNCGDFSIECAKDCIKLGRQYFKYSNKGFSKTTCVCYLNKEVEQIW